MQLAYLHEFVVEFNALDRSVQNQIRKKLDDLARTPFKGFQHQALKGVQFKGLYKYRIGDWRLIYRLRAEEICFITLGHRSEVYR